MTTGVYRQRSPQKTDLYKILDNHYENFKILYPEKYQQKYGFFRPEIDRETNKYLRCGIFKYGFAKIRCTNKECGKEFFLPYSCKSRGLCPSCMEKNVLQHELFLTGYVLEKVPYRHFVFTIPKMLRKNFFWHREHLNSLSRLAWDAIKEFMQETLKKDGVPGSIQTIETSGNLLDINCHIHALVTDGLFIETGTFYHMPNYGEGALIYLKSLWEEKVASFCIKEGFIKKETMDKILNWMYTGFSVYTETKIYYSINDKASLDDISQIMRYILKPAFALERISYNKEGNTVIYKGDFHKGKKQNFEIFTPEDFIAAITSHIPNYLQKYTNYYGYFSSKSRGLRKKVEKEKTTNTADIENLPSVVEPTDSQKAYSRTWAILIKRVWEVDPLVCPECSSKMRVACYIDDPAVIEKILRHVGLWKEQPVRAPPKEEEKIKNQEVERIPYEDDWSPAFAE